MNKKVSIIILNYNGLAFLKKCIPSILSQTYKDIEIFVSDNNSTDGSREYIEKRGDVLLIKNADNYGYAKANNIGARKATGEYILFLNNDTVLERNCIQELVRNYSPRSILSPAQIRPWEKKSDGSAQFGTDIFGYPYGVADPRKTRPFYADGAAIFMRRKDFMTIGMFDEELFIFQEDIDFSWRAQMMGYRISPCWDSKLIHYGGATVEGGVVKEKKYASSYLRRYLNEKNVIRNLIKNYGFPLNIFLLTILLTLHVAEIFVLSVMGKWKIVSCYTKAYAWNIAHIKNTLSYRKMVQKKRTVSDLAVIRRMYFSYSKLIAFKNLGIPEVS